MKKYIVTTSLLVSVAQTQQICNKAVGESAGVNSFMFLGSGSSVLDKRTGLTWKRCLEGQRFDDNKTPIFFTDDSCKGNSSLFSRQDALLYVKKAKSYRLPNIKELASLVELKCFNPAINLMTFPNQPNEWVWSATYVNLDYSQSNALGIRFESGLVGFNGSKRSGIRLVGYKNLITS